MRGETKRLIWAVILLLATGFLAPISGQESLVPVGHPVYEWLHRQRSLGTTDGFPFEAQPVSRARIVQHLREVETSAAGLGSVDRDFLDTYLREFSLEGLAESARANVIAGEGSLRDRLGTILGGYREMHLYARADSGYAYAFDVFSTQRYMSVEEGASSFGSYLNEKGVRGFATFYDHFGLHLEVGNLAGSGERHSSERAIRFDERYNKTYEVVRQGKGNGINIEAMASARYRALSAHMGHGSLRYGPGQGEPLGLSATASAFDWIRFNIDTRLLRYTALHANLTADRDNGIIVLDGVDTVQTRFAPNRWMAMHRIEVVPMPQLQIGFSELLTYSARPLDYAYLNPISPLFFSELDNEDRDNAIWILDATWRPVSRIELSAAVLADDLGGLGDIFATDEGAKDVDRAFDFGAQVALPGEVDAGGRFLRIEPFVYTHWQALNAFEQRGFSLGHPLGPNSQQLSVFARKWLPRRSWLSVSFAQVKKGLNPVDGEGAPVNVGGDILTGRGNTGFRFLEGADVQEYREIVLEGVFEPWRGIRLSGSLRDRALTAGTRILDLRILDVSVRIGL